MPRVKTPAMWLNSKWRSGKVSASRGCNSSIVAGTGRFEQFGSRRRLSTIGARSFGRYCCRLFDASFLSSPSPVKRFVEAHFFGTNCPAITRSSINRPQIHQISITAAAAPSIQHELPGAYPVLRRCPACCRQARNREALQRLG